MLGGLILAVTAIFVPPLAVLARSGCGFDLLINILLCCLAWIPGICHAWYIILTKPSQRQRYGMERARSASRSSYGSRERCEHDRRTKSRSRSRSRSPARRSYDSSGYRRGSGDARKPYQGTYGPLEYPKGMWHQQGTIPFINYSG